MRRTIATTSPNQEYVTLEHAFRYFNTRLFEGKLPALLITYQRHKGTRGYYAAERFAGRWPPSEAPQYTDELALNPSAFADRTDTEILSTLVHEMVHHWQKHFGKPGRTSYHNTEWARKMQAVGLLPTDTGAVGGRPVGQKVTHLIIEGGTFDVACRQLLASGAKIAWQAHNDDAIARRASASSKTKYTCGTCGVNAWGKPDLHLVCGDCEERLEEA